MDRIRLIQILPLVLLALILSSVTGQNVDSSEQDSPTAEAAAKLFAENCFSCHNDVDKEGDLSMQTFSALMQGGAEGPSLVPGNADESRLILMVEGLVEPLMPEDDFLFDEDIKILRDWINAGAPPWNGDLERFKNKN